MHDVKTSLTLPSKLLSQLTQNTSISITQPALQRVYIPTYLPPDKGSLLNGNTSILRLHEVLQTDCQLSEFTGEYEATNLRKINELSNATSIFPDPGEDAQNQHQKEHHADQCEYKQELHDTSTLSWRAWI